MTKGAINLAQVTQVVGQVLYRPKEASSHKSNDIAVE